MGDGDVDLTEIREITPEMAATGTLRVDGSPVERGKRRLTMYLDAAIVEFFKSRAGTRGYQTLINETLKQAIERESLEDTLRRVIREEHATYQIDSPRKGAAGIQSDSARPLAAKAFRAVGMRMPDAPLSRRGRSRDRTRDKHRR